MRRLLVIVSGVLVLAGAAAFFLLAGNAAEAPALPQGQGGGGGPPPAVVRTEIVEPQRLERTLRLNGTLLAREGVELRSEVSGVVREVAFEEGAYVEKDTALLHLDDRELQAERRSVLAELDLAERNEARLDDLRGRGAASQRDYDEALSRLNMLRARVEILETRISKSVLHAPFSGVVGLRRVSPGDFLTPQDIVALLNDIDELKVDFPVPERHQGELRLGLPIRVSAGGLEEPREGLIRAIEPQVDTITRTILARATVNNDDRRLLPGNFAVIEVVLAVNDVALLVPSTAIVPGLREARLFVVHDGRAEERVVRIGRRMERHVEVLEGLEAGEAVVVRGADGLRAGQPVRLQQQT